MPREVFISKHGICVVHVTLAAEARLEDAVLDVESSKVSNMKDYLEEYSFKPSVRGLCDSDRRDFDQSTIIALAKAGEEFSYLLDRGYPRDSALEFVGNRYQFKERQRLLLARAVAGTRNAEKRKSKMLGRDDCRGADVLVDGFNLITTIEVALCGSPLVVGQDSTIRDLAGLRGTYHPIDKTPLAIDMALDSLDELGVSSARFLIDKPVSNSGRLKALVAQLGEHHATRVMASNEDIDVDKALYGCEFVITSDSVVLDKCNSWINLAAIVVDRVPGAWKLDIFGIQDSDSSGVEIQQKYAPDGTPDELSKRHIYDTAIGKVCMSEQEHRMYMEALEEREMLGG